MGQTKSPMIYHPFYFCSIHYHWEFLHAKQQIPRWTTEKLRGINLVMSFRLKSVKIQRRKWANHHLHNFKCTSSDENPVRTVTRRYTPFRFRYRIQNNNIIYAFALPLNFTDGIRTQSRRLLFILFSLHDRIQVSIESCLLRRCMNCDWMNHHRNWFLRATE